MGKGSFFLSRKSIWRKTNSCRNDKCMIPFKENENNKLPTQSIEDDLEKVNIIPRLRYLLFILKTLLYIHILIYIFIYRSALSLSTVLTMTEKEKLLRTKDIRILRFSSTVHVCLIPSRIDLKPNLIDLYWKSEDYIQFKLEAVYELRAALTLHKITAKEAINLLYQPKENDRLSYDNLTNSPTQSSQAGLIRNNSLSGISIASIPFITGIKTDVRLINIPLFSFLIFIAHLFLIYFLILG